MLIFRPEENIEIWNDKWLLLQGGKKLVFRTIEQNESAKLCFQIWKCSQSTLFSFLHSPNISISLCADFRIKGAYLRFKIFCLIFLHKLSTGRFESVFASFRFWQFSHLCIFFFNEMSCVKRSECQLTTEAHFGSLNCISHFSMVLHDIISCLTSSCSVLFLLLLVCCYSVWLI